MKRRWLGSVALCSASSARGEEHTKRQWLGSVTLCSVLAAGFGSVGIRAATAVAAVVKKAAWGAGSIVGVSGIKER